MQVFPGIFEAFLAFTILAHAVNAALYIDASQLPTLNYDFVVIGGMSLITVQGLAC